MPTVQFTPNIQRHVDCPPSTVDAPTVRAALDEVFAQNPKARGYILDERGAVRRHIVIFVNNQPIHDRTTLADKVSPTDEIFVFQALSGG